MPTANVIQLRQLLREKMPDLRQNLEAAPAQRQNHWPTGLPQLDAPLHGGLPRGALTEITATQRGSGSALLINSLLHQAAREKQIIALIDGRDSLDVTSMEPWILARLLWVRSQSAEEALKSTDLLLRDPNVSLVLLDLMANPVAQVRRIPTTTWFRFQRMVEPTATVCLVLTPQPIVSSAQTRITLLPPRFSLDALDCDREELLGDLKLEVSDARRHRESGERLRHFA